MIASFLPLPMNPMSEMRKHDNSTSILDDANEVSNDFARHLSPIDEARYLSARWWRGVNRCMSLVGVLIIVVVVS